MEPKEAQELRQLSHGRSTLWRDARVRQPWAGRMQCSVAHKTGPTQGKKIGERFPFVSHLTGWQIRTNICSWEQPFLAFQCSSPKQRRGVLIPTPDRVLRRHHLEKAAFLNRNINMEAEQESGLGWKTNNRCSINFRVAKLRQTSTLPRQRRFAFAFFCFFFFLLQRLFPKSQLLDNKSQVTIHLLVLELPPPGRR